MVESIYNWIQPPRVEEVRPPMYRSTLPESPVPNSTFREATRQKPIGVIGKEVSASVRPDKYLRAHELTASTVDPATLPKKFHRPDSPRKPKLPSAQSDSSAQASPRSARNYVEANAIDAILTPVRHAATPPVDWLSKPEYGKVPEYLSTIQRDISAEKELVRTQQAGVASEALKGKRELPAEERDELLAALKKRHDEVMSKFQLIAYRSISTSTSTLGEIRYKETFEKQLIQLEADIKRLSVKGPIYIVDA